MFHHYIFCYRLLLLLRSDFLKVAISLGKLNDYCVNRIEKLSEKFSDVEFEIFEDREETDFSQSDIIVSGRLSIEDLRSVHNLKALFVPFTGVNKFPLKELNEQGVVVCNSHGKAPIVAERAFALAMATLGRVVEMHNLMKDEGVWLTRKHWGIEFWTSLFNKKCGILGMGNIGCTIIRLLEPFNCEIVALDRDKDKNMADRTVSDIETLAEYSDVLFVCLPLVSETKGIINKQVLSKMQGKFIINVARGEIIDEEALYWALENNILAGVGMDVWYNYPTPPYDKGSFPSRFPIHEFKNVVMSPHAASHAIESKNDYYEDTFDQVDYFLETNTFKRKVNIGKYLVELS